jgi:hypothetical protein
VQNLRFCILITATQKAHLTKYVKWQPGAHAVLQPQPKYPHRHTVGHRGSTTIGASGITATAGGATSGRGHFALLFGVQF